MTTRKCPETRLRHRCSSRSLHISPLHREFQSPLHPSRTAVSADPPRLSRGISRPTRHPAYAPFTPSDSEQRLPPLSYRGCWHSVGRGFLCRHRQMPALFTPTPFFPSDRGLRPEGPRPPRGVTPSGFRPLRKIPHCCLP